MRRDQRGVALTMAVVTLVLIEGFAAMALAAVTTRYRLTSDARFAIEARLFVATALATARANDAAALASLEDGEHRTFPPGPLGSGWLGRTEAVRSGSLVRLSAWVEYRRGDGRLLAGRRATLLLVRGPADTLRVLRSRARF